MFMFGTRTLQFCEDPNHEGENNPDVLLHSVDGIKRCRVCHRREMDRRMAKPLIPSDNDYRAR